MDIIQCFNDTKYQGLICNSKNKETSTCTCLKFVDPDNCDFHINRINFNLIYLNQKIKSNINSSMEIKNCLISNESNWWECRTLPEKPSESCCYCFDNNDQVNQIIGFIPSEKVYQELEDFTFPAYQIEKINTQKHDQQIEIINLSNKCQVSCKNSITQCLHMYIFLFMILILISVFWNYKNKSRAKYRKDDENFLFLINNNLEI